jgi:hypothetical protein
MATAFAEWTCNHFRSIGYEQIIDRALLRRAQT